MRYLILSHTHAGPVIAERRTLDDLASLFFCWFLNGCSSSDGSESAWVFKQGKWQQLWPFSQRWAKSSIGGAA